MDRAQGARKGVGEETLYCIFKDRWGLVRPRPSRTTESGKSQKKQDLWVNGGGGTEVLAGTGAELH